MSEERQASAASPSDIKRSKCRCWSPGCKHIAWFEDWGGWHWCFYHAYQSVVWGGGRLWNEIRGLKLRWPF